MADLTDAKVRFLGTLQIAGIIHPHAGHEQVVLAALDEFEGAVLMKVVDLCDLAPAKEEPTEIAGLPSAEDLDAVAAEEAARQATSGAALATEDAPVEIENEGYAVDDGTQVQTEGAGAESEQPEPETDEPQPETEEQQPETDEPVTQDEVVADGD